MRPPRSARGELLWAQHQGRSVDAPGCPGGVSASVQGMRRAMGGLGASEVGFLQRAAWRQVRGFETRRSEAFIGQRAARETRFVVALGCFGAPISPCSVRRAAR
jgi:hypothetical protein